MDPPFRVTFTPSYDISHSRQVRRSDAQMSDRTTRMPCLLKLHSDPPVMRRYTRVVLYPAIHKKRRVYFIESPRRVSFIRRGGGARWKSHGEKKNYEEVREGTLCLCAASIDFLSQVSIRKTRGNGLNRSRDYKVQTMCIGTENDIKYSTLLSATREWNDIVIVARLNLPERLRETFEFTRPSHGRPVASLFIRGESPRIAQMPFAVVAVKVSRVAGVRNSLS